VDLAPTLTELCGLPAHAGFEGRSLAPVLKDASANVNEAAYSWYPKSGYLGLAMRTDKWRYVEWTKPGAATERELYDMSADPQNDQNLAGETRHAALIDSLSRQLREKFPVQEFINPESPPGRNRRNR
jgi:iduronate 2-sulfatase